MPILVENNNVKPTIITEPDVRFATTFLTTRFRDYAVPGEALMDKVSGELFIKREDDGKIVSFFQNKRLYYDLMLELKILLGNAPSFTYPKLSKDAYLVSTNYDLIAMNEEILIDLVKDDIVLEDGQFVFRLSKETNGFFFRQSTRDCDKPIVELLTNQLDKDRRTAGVPTNDTYGKNAILHYSISADEETEKIELSSYIKLNETCPIFIPDDVLDELNENYPSASYYTIQVDSIDILIKSLLNKEGITDEYINDSFDTIIYDDNRVEVAETNVLHFVDRATDILKKLTQTLLYFVDMLTVRDLLNQISKIATGEAIILSEKKPSIYSWSKNNVWAEKVNTVEEGGIVTPTNSITKISALQEYFTNQYTYSIANVDTNEDEEYNMESMNGYTTANVDTNDPLEFDIKTI